MVLVVIIFVCMSVYLTMLSVSVIRRVQGFGGESEGKIPLGRPRCRWEDNIKKDIKEVGCGGMDWIELASTCECGNELRVP
jgi:hypothetical protein